MSDGRSTGRATHPASLALREYGVTCSSVCRKAGVYPTQWSVHFVTGRHNGPSAERIRNALREMLTTEQYEHVISLVPERPYHDGGTRPLTEYQREVAGLAVLIDEIKAKLTATGVPKQTVYQWKLKLYAERDQ